MKRFIIGVVVLLTMLGGIAAVSVVAAHRGWQPPHWLSFLGGGGVQPVDVGLFCKEHGVPEKFCTLCHEELKSRLVMCKDHGLPEEVCTICHPENEQKYGLKMICKEHGLPSHLCTKCNPTLLGGEVESDWCPTHGVPQSLCTRCKPELAQSIAMCATHGLPQALCTVCRPELAKNFSLCEAHQLPAAFCPHPNCEALVKSARTIQACAEHGADCTDGKCKLKNGSTAANALLPLVRLAGADVASDSGILSSPVTQAAVAPVVTANGEVGYDETRLAHVRPRVAGIIREVLVKPGDSVREGQALVVIDSAELGQAKAEYLAAAPMVDLWQKTLSRGRGLNERGIVAEKQVLEAEAELQRAKAELLKAGQRLRNFGFDDEQIAKLAEEDANERNQMAIQAPLSGTVVRRKAVAGEAVEATTELFTVADLSRMWVHLSVYEKDLRRIRAGQPVTFRVPGLAPTVFRGQISWIDSEVNDQTRTIRVRAELDNKEGLLRANMFGKGEIQLGEPHTSLVVPRDAIQWEGSSYVVFVQKQPDQYEPRRVLIGQSGGKQMELAWADLKPGELVVTTGSFLLKTEIQKGSIGAGCCGE